MSIEPAALDFRFTLDELSGRINHLTKIVTKLAQVEYLTPRILRLPVGLTADRAYAVVGGPNQSRQWHIRRCSIISSTAFYPITLYSDESLSSASTLWVFEEEPAQETWGREEMVLQHPDVLVISAGEAGAWFGGHIQAVDMPMYGARNEPSEA
jgi:hypothetical protein